MYKSKLQELCQKRSWSLPKYITHKHGLDHIPSFSATVIVNHQSLTSRTTAKSSKEAQNEAAKLAFEHFSLPPDSISKPPIPSASSFPQPSFPTTSGSSGETTELDTDIITTQLSEIKIKETHPNPLTSASTSGVVLQVNGSTSVVQEENKSKGVQLLYKNELQMYAQKRNLVLPVYSCEREGPPHASRFRSRVTIGGQTYESPEFFPTLKEAEHAAARVALMSFSPAEVLKDDSSFYKNLLQEMVQKEGLCLPIYATNKSGEPHCPTFIATVEIEGEYFAGEVAKTKKQAEMNAAKVAYKALMGRKSNQTPLILSTSQPGLQGPDGLPLSLTSNVSSYLQHHDLLNTPTVSNPREITMQEAEAQTGKGCSFSSDIVLNSFSQQSATYASCESNDSSSPYPSNCSTNIVADSRRKPSSRNTLPYKKVIISPANMPIPDGFTKLPISDDNWVAFCPPMQEGN
ncbi:hypothetical protein UlMin_006912 [Ulmus minor]